MARKPQSPSPPRSSTLSTWPRKLTSAGSARSLLATASLAAAEGAARPPSASLEGLGIGRRGLSLIHISEPTRLALI
eukprot:3090095-Alexandrium_andersonii.AAC.1